MVLSRCQPYRAPMQRGETCAESLHAVRACAAEGEMFQHEIGIVTHAAPANGPGYAYGATCKNCRESVRLGGEHLARLRTIELDEITYRRLVDLESLNDAAATPRPPHKRAKRHAAGVTEGFIDEGPRHHMLNEARRAVHVNVKTRRAANGTARKGGSERLILRRARRVAAAWQFCC